MVDPDVALRFANLIAAEDYKAASLLLTADCRRANPPERLKQAIVQITRYRPGPIVNVELVKEGTSLDWPDKQPGDLVSYYIALDGEGFTEAVSVVLTQAGDQILIRALEWGRP